MTESRRFGAAEAMMFLVVLAAAAGARIWYLSACADNAHHDGPLRVQEVQTPLPLPPGTEMRGQAAPTELDALIHNLKEHQWFGGLAPFAGAEERTAHVAPGYPWLLSLLERAPVVVGPVDRTVRWIQCGLGSLTAGFYFLFTLSAFRSRLVAVLAGLFCALHPFWIISTAEIDNGVLTGFLLSFALLLGVRGGRDGGALTSLLYGLTLAGLALLRAALLPFAFVAVLWYLLRCRTLRTGWLYALVAFLGFLIGVTPWTLRNLQATGDLIPLVDSTHLHLWMGNNPRATGGSQSEETMLLALAEEREESPRTTARTLAKIENQKQRYVTLSQDVAKQVQSNPEATVRRRINAGLFFLFGERWFQKGQLASRDSAGEREMPPWLEQSYALLLQASLLGMLLLALLGWRWSYAWRWEAMPSSIALVWVPLPYILSHAGELSGPRLPLDGVLLTYAAFALACIVPGVGAVLWNGPSARNCETETPHPA